MFTRSSTVSHATSCRCYGSFGWMQKKMTLTRDWSMPAPRIRRPLEIWAHKWHKSLPALQMAFQCMAES